MSINPFLGTYDINTLPCVPYFYEVDWLMGSGRLWS